MIRLDTWEVLPIQNKMYRRQEMAWSSSKTRWTILDLGKALATLNLPTGRDLIRLDSEATAKTKAWITWAETTNIPIVDPTTWISKRINHPWCLLLQVRQTPWTIQTWIQWTRPHSQAMALPLKINNQTTDVHSSQISQPQIVIQEANFKRTQSITGRVWKFLNKKAHTSLRRGLQCCAGMSVIATSRTAGSSLPCRTLIEEDMAIKTNSSSMTTMKPVHLVRRVGQQELLTRQKEA